MAKNEIKISLIRRVWTDTTNHYYSHTEYQVLGFICNPKTALSQVMKVSPMELSDEMIYELFAAMDLKTSQTAENWPSTKWDSGEGPECMTL